MFNLFAHYFLLFPSVFYPSSSLPRAYSISHLTDPHTVMPTNPFQIEQYTTTPCDVVLPDYARNAATVYFGFIVPHMVDAATAFAEKHGIHGDFRTAITQFLDFAKDHYLGPEHPCGCLWVRFTVSSDDWQTQRPHLDGWYWDPKLDEPGKETFKVGTCFVGPGTLFFDVSKCKSDAEAAQAIRTVDTDYYERMKATGVDAFDIDLRKWAQTQLSDMGVKPVQVPPNHCVRWVVGDQEKAAIHSEPDQSNMPKGRVL